MSIQFSSSTQITFNASLTQTTTSTGKGSEQGNAAATTRLLEADASYASSTSFRYSGQSAGQNSQLTYSKNSQSHISASASQTQAPEHPGQSPEKTAVNILRHVTRNVEMMRQQGASEEQVQSRLDAAREGIAAGYADAKDMLEGMGKLSVELEAEINKGFELVMEGLDQLAQGESPELLENYAPSQPAPGPDVPTPTVPAPDVDSPVSSAPSPDVPTPQVPIPDTSEPDVPTPQIPVPPAPDSGIPENEVPEYDVPEQTEAPAISVDASREQQSSFNLQVMTADGDQVEVTFNRSVSGSLSYSNDGSDVSLSASRDAQWSLSVEGELDQGEMDALNQLMQDAVDISKSFFAGDLGEALSAAMELGYDNKELASFSLELKQRSVSSVSRAYGNAGPEVPAPLQPVMSQLASYTDQYLNALEKAGQLKEPDTLFDQMLSRLMPEERQYLGLKGLNEGLQNFRA